MKVSRENRPSKLWPIGSAVDYLDAYGLNPVKGKVIAHYPVETNILVEDTRGIRHFGQTWRIDSAPPSEKGNDLFDDLLGDGEPAAPADQFEDLLG